MRNRLDVFYERDAHPRRLESAQRLLDDDLVRAVQQDAFFWTLVENGSGSRAVNQMSFLRLSSSDELRDNLAAWE